MIKFNIQLYTIIYNYIQLYTIILNPKMIKFNILLFVYKKIIIYYDNSNGYR